MRRKKMSMQNSNNQDIYNEEPVFYCKHCLSLKIRNETRLPDLDYCDECGSTDIETTNIHNWEDMYKQRYGFKFLNR